MKRQFDLAGTSALLLGIICWGAMPVFLRTLTADLDAFTANGLRYPFAAILYWPIIIVALRAGRVRGDIWRRALVPAAFSFGAQVFFAMAPYYVEASVMGFLIKLSSIWVLIGAMILFPDERPLLRSPRFYLGLLLALGGFAWLAVANGVFETKLTLQGVGCIFLCSIGFGAYGVSVRKCLRDVPPLVAFGVVAQYVSMGTIALMMLWGAPSLVYDFEAGTWWLLAFSSIIGIGISHSLYFIAIRHLGATISSCGHLLGPFVTLALASFFLSESMSSQEWCAGILMVVGGSLLILAQVRLHVDDGGEQVRNEEEEELPA